MIIQEELKSVNGPSGSTYGEVIDKDTNEPIAKYEKDRYIKGYKMEWHPTFLELNPGMKDSLEAKSMLSTSGYKEAPESLASVVSRVQNAHNAMAAKGFQDTHHVVTKNQGEVVSHDLHDRKTGDHLATMIQGKYSSVSSTVALSPTLIEKHNIPEDVVGAVNKKLSGLKHHEFVSKLESEVKELTKKKHAVGIHSFGDVRNDVYHISSTPEEASSKAEEVLKGKGHTVNRLSPTHFVATSGDGETTSHSMVVGDKLHIFTSRVGGYSAKKYTNSLSF